MDFEFEVKSARELLQYVNDKLKNDNEFFKLDSEVRYKKVSEMNEYKQFILSFPIVSRYIIQLGIFSSKCFRKLLKHLNTVKPTPEERAKCINNNEEQMMWLNAQRALYIKWLHMEKSRNHNVEEANTIYQNTVKLLNDDTKKMFKIMEEEKEKAKQQESKYNDELKQHLLRTLTEKKMVNNIVDRINEL